jgi:monovalent cation/hydrogen antiporter
VIDAGLLIALLMAITHTGAGQAFPHRSLVIFLAYAAVLVTLVAPGVTLGPMVRRLGLQQGAVRRRRLAEAQATILHAALEEIEALAAGDRISEDGAERLRGPYQARLDRLDARRDRDGDGDPGRLAGARRAILDGQRRRLAELRRRHAYPADLLREIEHDLDLDEARLG